MVYNIMKYQHIPQFAKKTSLYKQRGAFAVKGNAVANVYFPVGREEEGGVPVVMWGGGGGRGLVGTQLYGKIQRFAGWLRELKLKFIQ
jgi:hypothetical protein